MALSSDLEAEFGWGYQGRQREANAQALLLLAEVAKTIRERGEAYGPPSVHWTRTAALWTALLSPLLKDGAALTPRHVALLYVLDKASRDMATPQRDSLVDIAGYVAGAAGLP